MKWYDVRISKMVLLVVSGLLAAFLLTGCRTTRYVPVDKLVYRESVKHDTLHKLDSVYVHDSISTFIKGDTLFRDRWHEKTVLKEIFKNKTDTFIKRDSIPVPYPVEKELSKWEQFQLKYAIWSMGALCAVLLYLCRQLYKKIKNGRNQHNNIKK